MLPGAVIKVNTWKGAMLRKTRETDKERGLQSLSTSNTTPEPLACLSSSDDLGVPVEVAVAPEHLQRGAHSSEWGCGEGKQQRIWTL